MTKNETQKEIEITDYTDYGAYLSDIIKHKRDVTKFSYRSFCRKSGFRSPTYLKWVIDGVRPISLKSVHKFAAGLSLDRRETQYFTLMVNYKEAPDLQTKRTYYEQMLTWQKRRGGSLTRDAYEYLSHWYYVAIRELIASPDFKDDPHWIRDRLGGDLTVWEVRNGLETLERLNLIRRDSHGRWRQVNRDLETEHEVRSLAAYNYHAEMLELAQRTLSKISPDERDYQSLVAMIDRETFAALKAKIHEFQRSLVDYLKRQEQLNNNQRVRAELYALNMQLLPLLARAGGRDYEDPSSHKK